MQGFGLHASGFSFGIYGCAWRAAAAVGLGVRKSRNALPGLCCHSFPESLPPPKSQLHSMIPYDELPTKVSVA